MSFSEEDAAPRPLFHERRTYRRKRVMDAARFLPLVGLLLWLIPLLWPQTGPDQVSSSAAILYIFGAWGFLMVVAGLLSLGLRQSAERGADDPS